MEKMEMVEKLIARADITMEEAKDILERNEWDLLNATIELEKEGRIKQPEQTTGAASEEKEKAEEEKTENTAQQPKAARCHRFREAARSLFRMGIDNKFLVNKGEEVLIKVPVILPIVFIAANIWCAGLALFFGMVFGLRYSFEGKELGKDVFNKTMVKASEATNEFVTNLADKKAEEAV